MLAKGQVVNVFSKPLSGEGLEGRAKLVTLHRSDTGDGLTLWSVEFLDEPGSTYPRTINESNAEPTLPHEYEVVLRVVCRRDHNGGVEHLGSIIKKRLLQDTTYRDVEVLSVKPTE